MVNSRIQTTAIYSIFSIAALFLVLWITDYSSLGIPEMIPNTGLRFYGVIIGLLLVLLNFLYQRQLVKQEPVIPVLHLILLSMLVFLVSLMTYQLVRQLIIADQPFSSQLLLSVLVISFLLTLVASSTSLALKKANGLVRRIPLLIIVIIVIFAKKYIAVFEW